MFSKRIALAVVIAAFVVPSTSAAHGPAPTIRQAKRAIIDSFPIEVLPGPCYRRKHWTDCWVTAPLEELSEPAGFSIGAEALHWTARVFWRGQRMVVVEDEDG